MQHRLNTFGGSAVEITLHRRHNGRDGVSNNQPHDCLLNRLIGRWSKKTSKLRMASDAKMFPFDDVIMKSDMSSSISTSNGTFVGSMHWFYAYLPMPLKFVSKGSIGNKPVLVQINGLVRTDAKPFSEPMIARCISYCLTRHQWVNSQTERSSHRRRHDIVGNRGWSVVHCIITVNLATMSVIIMDTVACHCFIIVILVLPLPHPLRSINKGSGGARGIAKTAT